MLGVFQLKRIWASKIAARQGRRVSPERHAEWQLDHIAFCALNLALEETLQYLMHTGPSFEQFERWILARNDGGLDACQVARFNAVVTGRSQLPASRLPALEGGDPVLSDSDRAHWAEHGYVVVREAISREQAAAAAGALWRHRGMDPADPGTWYAAGSIMVQLFHHPALKANRETSRVRRAFAELWGRDDLWMTTDRVSFNPPERPGWRFPGPRLHWNADLSVRPLPFATQGLIYLTDTPAHQGAFALVPGFHRRLEAWLDALPPGADAINQDLSGMVAQPIAGEAGDLVIWHHALPTPARDLVSCTTSTCSGHPVPEFNALRSRSSAVAGAPGR